MIQPNELRKGSIFFDAGDEQSYFAIEYFEKDFAVYRNGSFKQRMDSDCFQPVELTPDILEAAGFGVNKDNSFGYINENEGILIELGDFDEEVGRRVFYYVLPDTDDYTCIAYCKHLHQLQNLYWCLCGQELQIDIIKLNKEK